MQKFQTLARVIGTVAKFDKKELDAIIHKEESRWRISYSFFSIRILSVIRIIY